jgi:hypothetical protein
MRIHERSRRNVSLALALFLPLFLTSFAAKCDRNKNNGNGNNANTGITREVDDQLRSKVRQNLTEQSGNSNTGLSALDIEVGVAKGKVTLTGTVRSQAAKDEATRIARETEVEVNGQKFKPTEVDASRLTVAPPSPSPTPSP